MTRREFFTAAIVGAAVAGAALGAIENANPPPPQVLVDAPLNRADWTHCVTERGSPLTAPPPGKARFNYHTRDGGTA